MVQQARLHQLGHSTRPSPKGVRETIHLRLLNNMFPMSLLTAFN